MGMADFEKLRREKRQKHYNKTQPHPNVQPNQNIEGNTPSPNNAMDVEQNDGQATHYPGK